MLESAAVAVLGAFGLLGVLVALDAGTLLISIDEPPRLVTLRGFTADAIEDELATELLRIERRARARPSTRELALESKPRPIEYLADYFELSPLVEAVQWTQGVLEYRIEGRVVEIGNAYVMSIDVESRDGTERRISVPGARGEFPALLDDAAARIMFLIDPAVLCAALLADAIESDGSLDQAESCVTAALPAMDRSQRTWLLDTAGVIRFVRGDLDGAMAYFVQALKIDPNYSVALMNVGILYGLQGRHDEALACYEALFRNLNDGTDDRTYGAAYAAWADSLAAVGRREQAERVYAQAVRADPRYAYSFRRWAGIVADADQAETLSRLGEWVGRHYDQLYVENLVGPVREAGLAAATDRAPLQQQGSLQRRCFRP